MRCSSPYFGTNQCGVECMFYKIELYAEGRNTLSILIKPTNVKKFS